MSATPAQPRSGAGDLAPDARTSTFSTTQAPLGSRLHLWEEYNEVALFGLRCSTLSERSLLATQTNIELPKVRLTHIFGNDHVIERLPANIRTNPVEAVMLCLLLEGNAFFYHDGGCDTLSAGEAVVYDPNRPFMYGFATPMRQVIVEVPRSILQDMDVREDFFRPRVLHIAGSPTAAHAEAAARSVLGLFSDAADAEAVQENVLDLFPLITGRPVDAPSRVYLATAKAYIEAHLGNPDLSGARLAHAVGISERHLARVFADAETTPAKFVLDARLARARELLTDPRYARIPIAEIATSVGFISAAHFSRAFRQHTGFSPRELRPQLG